jgi:diguanylate cyclase (GGDEF)-like protein
VAGIFSNDRPNNGSAAVTDLVAILIAVSVLLIFLSVSSRYVDALAAQLIAIGASNSSLIVGLLLLNVALTIYGWRRYRDAAREVVERTAAEKRANSLASTDPLTGCLNRRSMGPATTDLIELAAKRRQAVAMLIVDIDGFKTVNDVHGHHTGDNLLRTVAEMIQKALPRDAVVARLGGDEFAAAFSFAPTVQSEVDRIAEFLVDRLAKPFDLGGVHTHVSASIGVARSGPDCPGVEPLMRRADIAMHSAKKLGRNRYVWFDASMERELEHRNRIEAGLRIGIPAGQFVPFFEQQIDLASGSLHGFEMLARWQHPELGLVPPDAFIGIAEDSGLIGDLSLSVMRQAFEEARHWDTALTLSVNISPVQLKDPWLAQKITKLLVETGYPAERLEVEITESSLFESLGLAHSIVSGLKNQGIRLALDDFGTGYSSLAHLRALPFDRIKIDRSFVMSINDNPESVAIVTAITRLCESLGLAITAEGIEDEMIEARLRSIGTYKGQGYMFGRPMPAADVRKLLSSRALLPGPRTTMPTEVRDDQVWRRASNG